MSHTPLPRRRSARPVRVALAAVALLGPGALTGCAGVAASADKGEPVRVALGAAGGTRTVQAGDRLRVSADGGVLTRVTVTDPRGRRLGGALHRGGTVWTSHARTAPATKYSVVAGTRNPRGATGEAKESLTTATAERFNKPVFRPGTQGATVGVAQPLTVTFDFPVTDRAAVQRHLKVTTDNGTTGAWAWVTDRNGKDRVDWRPKDYWRPGTRISLRAELSGVDSGGGRYFATDQHLDLMVGPVQPGGPASRAAPANAPFTAGSASPGRTDSDAQRLYGKIRVGDPFEVTGSSLRGKAHAADGFADWTADRSSWQESSAPTSSS